jgi:hypothetical protein
MEMLIILTESNQATQTLFKAVSFLIRNPRSLGYVGHASKEWISNAGRQVDSVACAKRYNLPRRFLPPSSRPYPLPSSPPHLSRELPIQSARARRSSKPLRPCSIHSAAPLHRATVSLSVCLLTLPRRSWSSAPPRAIERGGPAMAKISPFKMEHPLGRSL